MAKTDQLFEDDNPLALRQKNTEPLILPRLLKAAGDDQQLEDAARAAHPILLRWADLESSGELANTHETQLQGPFCDEILGQALGYAPVTNPADDGTYHLEQEFHVANTGSGGGSADAALGLFKPGQAKTPRAVVELKGANIHLDRSRSNGRNAVAQCWDYLYALPADCRWGIVSNFVSFRLYDRTATPAKYEHFTLQSLRKFDVFRRFYAIFHRKGLIEKTAGQDPRILALIKNTNDRQREVGDELYGYYSQQRTELIAHLMADHGQPLDMAIEMAQRLFDRIIFIAFCEDRGLLPDNTLRDAHDKLPAFSAVTNPRWQNYKTLFRFVDTGNDNAGIPQYNGGLFANHPVDDLTLEDGRFTTCFRQIGEYDFGQEVNLDVLGHLFERSITEIEKLKETGLFGGDTQKAREYAEMPQSAKRKQLGTYYTPAVLTERIVRYTVDELVEERFAALADELEDADRVTPGFWRGCFATLRNLKIVDPACGSGAFLFQAYQAMALRYGEVIDQLVGLGLDDAEALYEQIPRFILNDNLYGVDLSPEAVEISQLALWIQSADKHQTLATLSHNIVLGNSLVHDPEVAEHGFDWKEKFPEVFASQSTEPGRAGPDTRGETSGETRGETRGETCDTRDSRVDRRGDTPRLARQPGFDCVIGNPPWERIKLQEREFFSLPAPEIATASNAAKRRKLVAKLESEDPGLYARYQEALKAAQDLLTYCRKSKQYPLTGKGDINTYAVFAELATQLVNAEGRVGLLVPSGIASDMTTKDFFASIAEHDRLIRLYDFENKKVFFPEVHASFKFSILNLRGDVDGSETEPGRAGPDTRVDTRSDTRGDTRRDNMRRSDIRSDIRGDTPRLGDTDRAPAVPGVPGADFIFFAHSVDEIEDPRRHVKLTGEDIKLLNPNTRTCPIFRSRRDAEITKAIYKRVPVLIDKSRKKTGNPWGVTFKRMFDQTNDAELFREAQTLQDEGYKLEGNRWVKSAEAASAAGRATEVYVPVYEAKMVQMFDHRAADVSTASGNWVRQGQTEKTTSVNHQSPEHAVMPRFWTQASNVSEAAESATHFLAYKDVTSPTNQRTMIASILPYCGVVNSAPIVLTQFSAEREICLAANLNSFAYDYIARQKISNVHLNFFILEQIPTLPPDRYDEPCPWEGKTTLEAWISERVLKLSCTAEDMLPLAEACGFTSGSFTEYGGKLNKWNERERALLCAELDAAYFILYGLDRDDAEYILSTFKGIHDANPLFGGASTAEHILETYDALSARAMGGA